MSGTATGWVGQNGPRPEDKDRNGVEYGQRARGLRFVLMGIGDSANSQGKHSHPGAENLAAFALYSTGQVRRICDDLELDGWVVVSERGGGRGKATVFDLVMDYREMTTEDLARFRAWVAETRASGIGITTGYARIVEEKRAHEPIDTRAPAADTRASGCATNGLSTEDSTEEPTESEPFDRFWAGYALTAPPGCRRKSAKPAAAKAFAAAVKRGNDPEVIVAGGERWGRYFTEKNEPAYDPASTTFLNQDRWNDEIPLTRGGRGVQSNLDAVREVQEAYEEHGVAPGDLFGFGQDGEQHG